MVYNTSLASVALKLRSLQQCTMMQVDCSPPGFPTKTYIENHPEYYANWNPPDLSTSSTTATINLIPLPGQVLVAAVGALMLLLLILGKSHSSPHYFPFHMYKAAYL